MYVGLHRERRMGRQIQASQKERGLAVAVAMLRPCSAYHYADARATTSIGRESERSARYMARFRARRMRRLIRIIFSNRKRASLRRGRSTLAMLCRAPSGLRRRFWALRR